jgi:hypothetical protein
MEEGKGFLFFYAQHITTGTEALFQPEFTGETTAEAVNAPPQFVAKLEVVFDLVVDLFETTVEVF